MFLEISDETYRVCFIHCELTLHFYFFAAVEDWKYIVNNFSSTLLAVSSLVKMGSNMKRRKRRRQRGRTRKRRDDLIGCADGAASSETRSFSRQLLEALFHFFVTTFFFTNLPFSFLTIVIGSLPFRSFDL